MIWSFILSTAFNLLARHLWSILFTAGGSTLFFCSGRGLMARTAVRAYVPPMWLMVAVGVALLLMVAQSISPEGSVRQGLWMMWTWIAQKLGEFFRGTAEAVKTKPVAKKRKSSG